MRWDIGIDLGTENAHVVEGKSGEIRDEAARLAFRDGRDIPICCGDIAYRIDGRTCAGVTVKAPMKDGVLGSNLLADRFLRWTYRQCSDVTKGKRFGAVITCAPFCRPVQREALLTAATDAGAAEAWLVRSDTASAIGAGLDLTAPEGRFVVDIGAGKITATVFTMGREAAFGYIPYGMNRLDERICRMVHAEKSYRISMKTAREIKHIVCAVPQESVESENETPPTEEKTLHPAGISTTKRMPGRFELEKDKVLALCDDMAREIVQLCTAVVAEVPDGAAADLYDSGVILTGGGAVMNGLSKRISDTLGIPCRVADEPERCAVKGLLEIMRNQGKYGSAMMESAYKGSGR